jgi:hypothetical protein
VLITFILSLVITAISSCPKGTEITVDDVLDKIESVQISSLTASVYYTRTDPILDRREIRTGHLLFRKSEGKREAAILFDTLIIGRRRETKQKHYIFSGRWMAEVDHDKKQFIKRELVGPDQEDVDPFELGSGPIPLPIGQSKKSVLDKFDVTFIEKPTEGPLEKLDSSVVGLHLVPKAKEEWEYINLFYDHESWLPLGVETVELDGTIRVSRLSDMQIDALNNEDSALLSIETPNPKEWSIDIQKLQRSTP